MNLQNGVVNANPSREMKEFFDRILLFSLCFFGRDDKVNKRINLRNEVVNAKQRREIKEFLMESYFSIFVFWWRLSTSTSKSCTFPAA